MTDEEFDEEFNEEFDEEFDEDFVEDYDGEFDEEFDEKRNEKIEKFYEIKEKAYPVRPYQVFGLDAFCGQAARTANRHRRSKAHSEYLADLRINANLAIQRKYDIVTPKSLIEDSGLIKEERIDGIFSEYGEHREWPSKQHQDIAVGMLKNIILLFPDKWITHSSIADQTSSSKSNKEIYSDLVCWDTAPNFDLNKINHNFGNSRDPSLIIEVVDKGESTAEAQNKASKLLTAMPTLKEIFLYEFTTKTWWKKLKGYKWEKDDYSPLLDIRLDRLNSNNYMESLKLGEERMKRIKEAGE